MSTGRLVVGEGPISSILINMLCDRDEAGPHERKHELQFLFAAMARHVDVLDAFIYDVGAAPGQVIEHAADRLFIARNRSRRQHDGIDQERHDRAGDDPVA